MNVNFDLLKKFAHKPCPCKVSQTEQERRVNSCPCVEFLETKKCNCKVFTNE